MLAIVVMMGACSMLMSTAALDVNKAAEEKKSTKAATLAAIKVTGRRAGCRQRCSLDRVANCNRRDGHHAGASHQLHREVMRRHANLGTRPSHKS